MTKGLIELTGKQDLEPIYVPERSGDVRHSRGDISKAYNILQYRPNHQFEQGIKLYYTYLEKLII
jgi:UDP-N-acetylglucosamine 4-epimerase